MLISRVFRKSIVCLGLVAACLAGCVSTTMEFDPSTGRMTYTSGKDIQITKLKVGLDEKSGKFTLAAESIDSNASEPMKVQGAIVHDALEFAKSFKPPVPVVESEDLTPGPSLRTTIRRDKPEIQ